MLRNESMLPPVVWRNSVVDAMNVYHWLHQRFVAGKGYPYQSSYDKTQFLGLIIPQKVKVVWILLWILPRNATISGSLVNL